MKEKLTNNLAIKLIALFCAFFVWLAVVNVANPIKVSTREVPVTITNDQVLEQADLAYDVVGKKTAVISFKIRTKDDYKVKASDFNAYADLSEMYDVTGAIPIRVEVVNNEELLESTPVVKSPEVIKITTEALQTKAFTLKAYPQGEAAAGTSFFLYIVYFIVYICNECLCLFFKVKTDIFYILYHKIRGMAK